VCAGGTPSRCGACRSVHRTRKLAASDPSLAWLERWVRAKASLCDVGLAQAAARCTRRGPTVSVWWWGLPSARDNIERWTGNVTDESGGGSGSVPRNREAIEDRASATPSSKRWEFPVRHVPLRPRCEPEG
jgi:hypothetical protein